MVGFKISYGTSIQWEECILDGWLVFFIFLALSIGVRRWQAAQEVRKGDNLYPGAGGKDLEGDS